MELTKLNKIARFAGIAGFEVRIKNEEYATFEKMDSRYSVEVVYDLGRKIYSITPVYISTSALNSDNVGTYLDFENDIHIAISIAEKLKTE